MTRLPSDSLAFALLAASRAVAAVIGGRTPESALARVELAARPAAMDLAYTTLRDFGRGDFLLGRLVERPPGSPEVRALLLVALARLERRPEDAHTIVDQAVRAAGRLEGGRYRGFANAVLRNFLRRRDALLAAADADDVANLRHPRWWLDRLRAQYPADWRGIALAGNMRPPMALRVNPRRADIEGCLAELAAAGIAARALDGAAILLERPIPVDRLPGFAEGRVSVQDQGAQRAAALLDAKDGMRVLDACAAPGGKTAHILERADAELLALEADADRAGRIHENLARLGLSAQVRVADCRNLAAWWDGRPFDRILADAPCSASGVARRHPDIKWLRRPGDIAGFARVQAEILDALWQTLAPGGRMLYATCSLFAGENGDRIAGFMARHADAGRAPTGGENNEWQLTPDAEHDGFYYALLEKRP
ncbi:MAG: 16S rRNA (cytosine(967)-C(5))-methyltransferase RsmB [Candidatus Nitricoxidivorans perseverans]|uniref:16S rRNA (cytosine(967)-C(5))-methyltransferase n=1 Tax=Candidatus Nitricoxidivorans perseverans TaxID=2975601 RepID=A0AA49FJD9_9PROT|nr:MAG: 16S rRNA (cytosine(967)-C(5))-methyltransferase RsmB [Candidatus Nitricoxidivorans perseverans]